MADIPKTLLTKVDEETFERMTNPCETNIGNMQARLNEEDAFRERRARRQEEIIAEKKDKFGEKSLELFNKKVRNMKNFMRWYGEHERLEFIIRNGEVDLTDVPDEDIAFHKRGGESDESYVEGIKLAASFRFLVKGRLIIIPHQRFEEWVKKFGEK